MGEVADDMLDGTVCQYCGVWHDEIMAMEPSADDKPIPWEPPGYPWTCGGCEKHTGPEEEIVHINPRKAKTIGCQDCRRWFSSEYALADHRGAKHG